MEIPDLTLQHTVIAELPDDKSAALPACVIAGRLDMYPATVGTVLRNLIHRGYVRCSIRSDPKPSRRYKRGLLKWVHEKKKHYWKIKELEDV